MNWFVYNKMLIPDKAPHVEPDLGGLDVMLKGSSAIIARYTSNFDCENQTQWWYVIKDDPMDISKLKTSNIRNQVRKGLKNTSVRKIDPIIHYNEMFELFSLVMSERPQHKNRNLKTFFNQTLNQFRGRVEIWGAYLNPSGKLVAYALAEVFDEYVNFREAYFNKVYHKFNVSNALFYTLNYYYLNELKTNYVCDGERSINHPTSIQNYLIKTLGFRKAYCVLNIKYKNKLIYTIISLLYPFRNITLKLGRFFIVFRNLYSLLKQEEIRRSCKIE
jgi:hypothetical protein